MNAAQAVRLLDGSFLYALALLRLGAKPKELSIEVLHYLMLHGLEEPLQYPRIAFDFKNDPALSLRRGMAVSLRLSAQAEQRWLHVDRLVFFGTELEPGLASCYQALQERHAQIPPQGGEKGSGRLWEPLGEDLWRLEDREEYSGQSLVLGDVIEFQSGRAKVLSQFTTECLCL